MFITPFIVFLSTPFGTVNFFSWCFLSFLPEMMEQYKSVPHVRIVHNFTSCDYYNIFVIKQKEKICISRHAGSHQED